jgi:hypothetical protein
VIEGTVLKHQNDNMLNCLGHTKSLGNPSIATALDGRGCELS